MISHQSSGRLVIFSIEMIIDQLNQTKSVKWWLKSCILLMKKERNKLRLRLQILEQEDRRLADSLEMLDDASSNIYGQIIETTKAPQKILAPH